MLWYRFVEYWDWDRVMEFVANGMKGIVNGLGEKRDGIWTHAITCKGR